MNGNIMGFSYLHKSSVAKAPTPHTPSPDTPTLNPCSRWSASNRPSQSDIIKKIRAVCPFTPSNKSSQLKTAPDLSLMTDGADDDIAPKLMSLNVTSSETPKKSGLPKPSILKLNALDIALSLYKFYAPDPYRLPLRPLGSDYVLSIQPVCPKSLSSTPSAIPTPRQYYHHLLRTTLLYSGDTPETLRTICIGHIYYKTEPTYWVVVIDLEHGQLFALRSDYIDDYERIPDEDEDTDEDMDMNELDDPKLMRTVDLLVFDAQSLKAVRLGDTRFLEADLDGPSEQYQPLSIDRFESSLVL
ncbi:hypothetical protein DL98DRAFT_575051 [Cadophora sp. DSE1049]|nr:hypothetical protein DL98DRAFT_575051 [Cadophora sp. DSE1049]